MADEKITYLSVHIRSLANGWVATWESRSEKAGMGREEKVYTDKKKLHEELSNRLGL